MAKEYTEIRVAPKPYIFAMYMPVSQCSIINLEMVFNIKNQKMS